MEETFLLNTQEVYDFLTEIVTETVLRKQEPWNVLKSLLAKKMDLETTISPLKPLMLGNATLPDFAESELWKSHPSMQNMVFVNGASEAICHAQSKLLSDQLNFGHICLKEVTQKFLNSYSSNEMVSAMVRIFKTDGVLPIEVTLYLLKAELKKQLETNPKGFLIEGFPSRLEEALEFEKQIQKSRHCILFDVDFNNLVSVLEYPNSLEVEKLALNLGDYQQEIESFVNHFLKLDKLSIIPADGNAQAIHQLASQQLVENLNFIGKSLILIGGPASGKGTISDLMLENMICCHISTGDLLRREIQNESFVGLLLKESISKGDLVPDDIIMNLLVGKIAQNKRFPIIILDGFPRTVDQAKLLSQYLDVSKVLYLKCKKETLAERIVNRGKTSGRQDDNEVTAKHRIATFLSETLPVLDYYKQRNLLVELNGELSVEKVWHAVQMHLN
eukprot:NODE_509_length_7455_cov_0.403208.p3 type:complete len:446 gc:universal NODE_509_length_7455_cov_0.403208:1501-164(-)